MPKVLLVFSELFLSDLRDRPGFSKFDRQDAAVPRRQLTMVMQRLSRDLKRAGAFRHLRAELLEAADDYDRVGTRRESFPWRSNFAELVVMPENGAYRDAHPHSYIARFTYAQIGWSVLSVYVESDDFLRFICLNAAPEEKLAPVMRKLKGDTGAFDKLIASALTTMSDTT